jgi:2,5-diamino-6-(ribosylamino)-4(3H)-pyrimidinone 5'-phosphate reductase
MRPRVLVNFAPSLDGKIAPAHHVAGSAPFVMSRHEEDGRRMKALRERSDAVFIGAGNLRAGDPDLMPSRLRLVMTHAGQGVEPTAKMFDPALGGEAIVVHAATMPEDKRESLRGRATLVELGRSAVDALELVEWLGKERGCRVVLCEGGGVLTAQLFAARAVDELYLTLVPRILGGSNAPTLAAGNGFEPDAVPDGHLVSCDRIGDELYLMYSFAWT